MSYFVGYCICFVVLICLNLWLILTEEDEEVEDRTEFTPFWCAFLSIGWFILLPTFVVVILFLVFYFHVKSKKSKKN